MLTLSSSKWITCMPHTSVLDLHVYHNSILQCELKSGESSLTITTNRKITHCLVCWGEIKDLNCLACVNCAVLVVAGDYEVTVTNLTLELEAMCFHQHDLTNPLMWWPQKQMVCLSAAATSVMELVFLWSSEVLSKCSGKSTPWRCFLHNASFETSIVSLGKVIGRLILDGTEDLIDKIISLTRCTLSGPTFLRKHVPSFQMSILWSFSPLRYCHHWW